MKLALLLGGGILGNGYLALVLYAGVRVGDGLVAFALRSRPLRYLGTVRRQHALLFEMRVWTDQFPLSLRIQSDLTATVYETLRKAEIEIPLPQREVRWRQG